ncbi:MAG: hypothetical protein KKA05_07385, partial [Alphaproteobacteria bacterium]|nr:hypothetical protein [Alphaproteobacteria bacterium]
MLEIIGRDKSNSLADSVDTGGGPADLATVLASTVFDLDATITDSYAGTGTVWHNMIISPADGAAQTDYDFYRGNGASSNTYPTFNGSAGSAAAYWSCDGGDYFALQSGTNTAFLNNLHKTTGGTDWWFAFTTRQPDGPARIFFATAEGATQNGIRLLSTTTELLTSGQGNGATFNNATGPAFPVDTDNIVIISHSHSIGKTRFWLNSATATEVTQAYNTTIANPANPAVIGAETDFGSPMINGSRIYSVAMGNEFLDNTQVAALIAHM